MIPHPNSIIMSKLSKLVKSFMAWRDFIFRRHVFSVDVFDKTSGRYVFSYFNFYAESLEVPFDEFKERYVHQFPDHELDIVFSTYVNIECFKERLV